MKVSVILLTYNHEKFIVQALESVLNQKTDFDYDVTIIEDYSPDKTREIVISYAQKYPDKIKLRLPDCNRNDNFEWMKAIDSAQGEYIALLDGDDYWTSPDKLQKQVDFLDSHPECSICFHPNRSFHEDGSQEEHNSLVPEKKNFFTFEDLFHWNFMPTAAIMFRKNPLAKLPAWYNQVYCADWVLQILTSQYGSIGYIEEVMGATRIHQGGAWHGINKIKQLNVVINDYKIMMANLSVMNNPIVTNKLSEIYFDLALVSAQEGNLKEARQAIINSFIQSPIHPSLSNIDRMKLLIKVYIPGINRLANKFKV